MFGKTFGIGLSRTGTSSLTEALAMLGYMAVHATCIQNIELFEASTDTPVVARYQELDKRYPGSRFTLTLRDMDSWLQLCQKHWYDLSELKDPELRAEYSVCRRELYGIDHFDADVFRQAYTAYVNQVRAYFNDRPDDLIEMNIVAGDGFEKLGPFLGKPLLDAALPRRNVGTASHAQDMSPWFHTIVSEHFMNAINAFREGTVRLGQLHLTVAAAVSSLECANDSQAFIHYVAYTALDHSPDDPEKFINFVFDNLPDEAATLSRLRSKALDLYHTAVIFRAIENNRPTTVAGHLVPALRYNSGLVANRGFSKGTTGIFAGVLFPHGKSD